MDCPPNTFHYVNLPDQIINCNKKFVAVGINRTIFFCENSQFYRFNVDHTRNFGIKMKTNTITAFILHDTRFENNINNSKIHHDKILEYLSIYQSAPILNPEIFKGLNKINIKWNYNLQQLETIPNILPANLALHSSYYANIDEIGNHITYIDHHFYNQLVRQYGYINQITVLLCLLNKYAPQATITIDPHKEMPIQLFSLYKMGLSIYNQLDKETIANILQQSYNDHIKNHLITQPPHIDLKNLVISYKNAPITTSYQPIIICCHLHTKYEWNYFVPWLYQLSKNPKIALIITYNDINLQPYIKQTLPDSISLAIENKGCDVGGFFRALYYINTKQLSYQYIVKLCYLNDFCQRDNSIDYLLSNLDNHILKLSTDHQYNMIGRPRVKMDYLHTNYIMKYLKRYQIQHQLHTTTINKLITKNNNQINRKTPHWRSLQKRHSDLYFISSGVFIARTLIFHPQIITAYDELEPMSYDDMIKNYGRQYATLAWIRIFGIIANRISDKNETVIKQHDDVFENNRSNIESPNLRSDGTC